MRISYFKCRVHLDQLPCRFWGYNYSHLKWKKGEFYGHVSFALKSNSFQYDQLEYWNSRLWSKQSKFHLEEMRTQLSFRETKKSNIKNPIPVIPSRFFFRVDQFRGFWFLLDSSLLRDWNCSSRMFSPPRVGTVLIYCGQVFAVMGGWKWSSGCIYLCLFLILVD